jgi:hypothetical protein
MYTIKKARLELKAGFFNVLIAGQNALLIPITYLNFT